MEKEFVQRKQTGKGLSAAPRSFVALVGGVRGKGQWGRCDAMKLLPVTAEYLLSGDDNSTHQKGQQFINHPIF